MVSGNSRTRAAARLVQILAENPALGLEHLTNDANAARSLVEREASKLKRQVDEGRGFSLDEVLEIAKEARLDVPASRHLLVGPPEALDNVSPQEPVQPIVDYLKEILRSAQSEVVVLTPFWDASALASLFHGLPRSSHSAELRLLLVDWGKRREQTSDVVERIRNVWACRRIVVFVHRTTQRSATPYPHVKCLVVDRKLSYLGSANFTRQGLRSHFELGVSLGREDSATLASMLDSLCDDDGSFSLAWDTRLNEASNGS